MIEINWTEAFYDRDYGQDQSRRMAIFDSVVEFLTSIGCRVKWTCAHDGADTNPRYGIYICHVAYDHLRFEHNPCFQIRWEFPAALVEKLDAKFGTPAAVANRDVKAGMP